MMSTRTAKAKANAARRAKVKSTANKPKPKSDGLTPMHRMFKQYAEAAALIPKLPPETPVEVKAACTYVGMSQQSYDRAAAAGLLPRKVNVFGMPRVLAGPLREAFAQRPKDIAALSTRKAA
jgi:hypothetical protein